MAQKLTVIHVASTKHVLAVSRRTSTPSVSAKDLVGSAGLLVRAADGKPLTAPPTLADTFVVAAEYQGAAQLDVVQIDWTPARDKLLQTPHLFAVGKGPTGEATEQALSATPTFTATLTATGCKVEKAVPLIGDEKLHVWVQVQSRDAAQPGASPLVLTGELKSPTPGSNAVVQILINPPLPLGKYTTLALVEGLAPVVVKETTI